MRGVAILIISLLVFSCKKQEYDIVIRNALIVDGTGDHSFAGAVAINADTIAKVGDLSDAVGRKEIDAKGLVLAPGFIDTHSHHDGGMFEERSVLAAISQGITTVVVGQDGFSHFPLSDFFEKVKTTPVSVNIASYSGHNTHRDSVLGKDYRREATEAEIETMKAMLRLDMEAGALGLSSGLEYDPGIYSTPDEVLELAKILTESRGRYISHIRSEDVDLWTAIDEAINIGREAGIPVQISHGKLAMQEWWGMADRFCLKLDSARKAGVKISLDVYPYTYWQSTMKVLFPRRDFTNLNQAEFALTQLTTAEGLIINRFSVNPDYVGKSLSEIAQSRQSTPAQTLIDLIAMTEKENGSESIIATSMYEADVDVLLKWRHANVCSDGSSHTLHPRGFGAFPKFFHKYVIKDRSISIEDAVHKMTGLSAAHMGFQKRGIIRVGNAADLVLFDPLKFSDHSTIEQPRLQASGLSSVWVSGKMVYKDGQPTGVYAGHVIRRQQ